MTIGSRAFITAAGIIALIALRQSAAEPRIAAPVVPTPADMSERQASIAERSGCDLNEKTDEALAMLSSAAPKIGTKTYRWTENRSGTIESRSDIEREMALVLLRLDTCENEQVTVTVKGNRIEAPDGYDIRPVERDNGILMNRWNTEFKARCPGENGSAVDCVVLADVEPDNKSRITERSIYNANGLWVTVPTQTRGIEYRTYAPYSRDVHTYELVREGKRNIQRLFTDVCAELARKGIRGQAYPDREICEYPLFSVDMFERLVLIEGAGMGEFIPEPERTFERVYVIFGMNDERAYIYTCSQADACGALQFTKRTYQYIRNKYRSADLHEDFVEGYQDHLNIGQAAVLLHADNLDRIKNALTSEEYEQFLSDPHVAEEVLAASYNTGVTRSINVLRAYLRRSDRSDTEWADQTTDGTYGELLPETLGYIAKLRFLFEWEGPRPKAP